MVILPPLPDPQFLSRLPVFAGNLADAVSEAAKDAKQLARSAAPPRRSPDNEKVIAWLVLGGVVILAISGGIK